MEGLFVFWLVMAGVCAIVAHSKGRSGVGFFVYGFLLWPIALVHALVMARAPESVEARAAAEGRLACPHCAEPIKPAARLCPHCRSELPAGWAQQKPPLSGIERWPDMPEDRRAVARAADGPAAERSDD